MSIDAIVTEGGVQTQSRHDGSKVPVGLAFRFQTEGGCQALEQPDQNFDRSSISLDLTLRRPRSPHLPIFTLLDPLAPSVPVTAREAGKDEADSLRNKRLHHPRRRRQPRPPAIPPSREQPIFKGSREHAIATNVRERFMAKEYEIRRCVYDDPPFILNCSRD